MRTARMNIVTITSRVTARLDLGLGAGGAGACSILLVQSGSVASVHGLFDRPPAPLAQNHQRAPPAAGEMQRTTEDCPFQQPCTVVLARIGVGRPPKPGESKPYGSVRLPKVQSRTTGTGYPQGCLYIWHLAHTVSPHTAVSSVKRPKWRKWKRN